MNERQRQLKKKYGSLFDEVAAILFRHDPMGINPGENTDEYEPEAGTILPRLREAATEEETLEIIHQEFMHWFGGGAGPKDDYRGIAAEVWAAWQKF